jgi:hypothetical protein
MTAWDAASLYGNARAVQAACEPCTKYALNSKMFVLKTMGSELVELAGRRSARRMGNVFLYAGIAALIGAVALFTQTFFACFICGALGAIFVWIARLTLRDLDRRRWFDKRTQLFTKDAAGDEPELCVPLADIVALQLLKKRVEGRRNSSGYECLELNLVLRDRSRVNVIVDGGVRRIEKDAQTLADFLAVPVWQADEVKLY